MKDTVYCSKVRLNCNMFSCEQLGFVMFALTLCKRKKRWNKGEYRNMEGLREREANLNSFLSMTCSCTPGPSLLFFSSFHWKPLLCHPRLFFIQHFINIIKHMHEKQINSKRQRSQKPGFVRLIFIFLSCVLFFYVTLFFSLREMERDMPFLSACASLWCFSGLFYCMEPA